MLYDENFVRESLHLQAVLQDKSDKKFVRNVLSDSEAEIR